MVELTVSRQKWVVADPMTEQLDFSELLEAAETEVSQGMFSPPDIKIPKRGNVDCFNILPVEVLYMIIQLLPSPGVLDLMIASPSFRGIDAIYRHQFWEIRFQWDGFWAHCNILEILPPEDKFNDPTFYKCFLTKLKVESRREAIDASPLALSLRNRRRI